MLHLLDQKKFILDFQMELKFIIKGTSLANILIKYSKKILLPLLIDENNP